MATARREVRGAVDDVTSYLTSIARFDLLTAEEEVDLAQTRRSGWLEATRNRGAPLGR